MINDVTGIILAGGKNKRMGTHKAFLKIGEKTIIEEIFAIFKGIFKEIIIVANETERFDFLGVKVVADIISLKGPLGGIHTGLLSSNNLYNFIVACDMPFINQSLVRCLLEEVEGDDVTVAEYNGGLQPLCAIYSKNCIEPIEKQLSKDNLKVTDFFKDVKVKIITEKKVAGFDLKGSSFVNINTPDDCRKFKCVGF